MKKIISLALALLMVATTLFMFTSCSKKTDWENIQAKGKFVVGMTIYAPMNYYDANGDLVEDSTGEFIGFDTELAKAVAKKLGLEVEFVEIKWDNKYSELAAGAIDCIWNGFTSNSKDADGVERSEKVDFTYAYLDNKQCVIVASNRVGEFTSAASLAGKTAAVEEGSAGETYAKDAGATVVTKSTQMDAFTELAFGTVDCIVVDRLLADKNVGRGDFANLAISTIEIDPEVYSIGCRKGSDFDEKINEVLIQLLNDGTIEALATKYNVRVTDTLMAKKTAQ
jgi:polar amino acid transport system substrate-binding protein